MPSVRQNWMAAERHLQLFGRGAKGFVDWEQLTEQELLFATRLAKAQVEAWAMAYLMGSCEEYDGWRWLVSRRLANAYHREARRHGATYRRIDNA